MVGWNWLFLSYHLYNNFLSSKPHRGIPYSYDCHHIRNMQRAPHPTSHISVKSYTMWRIYSRSLKSERGKRTRRGLKFCLQYFSCFNQRFVYLVCVGRWVGQPLPFQTKGSGHPFDDTSYQPSANQKDSGQHERAASQLPGGDSTPIQGRARTDYFDANHGS